MTREQWLSDLTLPLQIVGSNLINTPYARHISSQRAAMFYRNVVQAMIVSGAETARIQSGYETKYGKYCINPSWREHDCQILDIIPKYTSISNEHGNIIHNPETIVIFLDLEDGSINFFTVPDYVFLHPRFGYRTKKINRNMLTVGSMLTKDIKFAVAPNHDDDLYNLGVNANTVYMPLWGTTNDAMIISESLRKKLRYTEVNQKTFIIGLNDIPLNLYGDETHYKAFPDIGEQVRDDGLVLVTREYTNDSLISDITSDNLCRPGLHDQPYPIPIGSTILDINIFINKAKYNELRSRDKKEQGFIGTYSQFIKYQSSLQALYTNIIDLYNKYKDQYRISPAFSSLVKQAMSWSTSDRYRDLSLYYKKDAVDLIYITITYCHEQDISNGFKITSRDGAKGVIDEIWPDEDMPSYWNGSKLVHADLVITGDSPFNRLNTSQLYEQFVNFSSDIIVQRCIDNVIPKRDHYQYITDFISTVSPVYGQFIKEETAGREEEFLQDVYKNGIYWINKPFSNSSSPEMVLEVSKKFNIEPVQIFYNHVDSKGNKRQVMVKQKGIIGSKYIMLLGKLPHDALSAIEWGYMSHLNLPMKPGSNNTKQQSLVGQTPGRYGEDETFILITSLGPMIVARLLGVYSNSIVAQEKLQHHLLNDQYPTRLEFIEMTTEEIILSSNNIKTFRHEFAAAGYVFDIIDSPEEGFFDTHMAVGL